MLSIAKILGLHQLPDDAQLTQLAAFIRRRFPDVTEVEITAAVERWAAGELAPECRLFGALSLDWLGTVLAAYRADRHQHLRRDQAERDRRQREEQERATARELPDEFHHRLVVDYVTQAGALPFIADWNACWRYLRDHEHLPTLDAEERDELLELIRAEVHEARRAARRPDDVPIPSTADEWNAYARAWRARKYYEDHHVVRHPQNQNP